MIKCKASFFRKIPIKEHYKICYLYNFGWNGYQISDMYGVSYSYIYQLLNFHNVHFRSQNFNHRKIGLNIDFFKKINTITKAYFLGLFFADGNVDIKRGHARIGLICKDKHILDSFQNAIFSDYPYVLANKTKYNPNHSNMFCLSIYSREFVNFLISCGCVPNKTKTLKFPPKTVVPNHLVKYFILGVFDGDGSISFDKQNRICWNVCGTIDMMLKIREIIHKHTNVLCSVYQRDGRKNFCHIALECKWKVLKVMGWLYKGAKCYLYRKHDLFKILESKPLRFTENNVKCKSFYNKKTNINKRFIL